jgi:hypothetical protein
MVFLSHVCQSCPALVHIETPPNPALRSSIEADEPVLELPEIDALTP